MTGQIGFVLGHVRNILAPLGILGICLLLGACSSTSRPGGYYKDDGPGDHIPANLDQIPDAVPHTEALIPAANRPYIVQGQTYTPMTQIRSYQAQGKASWYGKRFHGKATSSGEPYDMFKMTAAHRTLPVPSYARVTNLKNGRSVVVRINDRGPFHSDRLIDVSYAAAHRIGLLGQGSSLVEVRAVTPEQYGRK